MHCWTIFAGIRPGLLAFYIVLALYFIYAATQARRRRKLQHRLLAQTGGAADARNFPVKYASEAFYKSWMKVFPWEAAGVLRLTDEGLLFEGQTNRGVALSKAFPAAGTSAAWVGRKAANGATAWLSVAHGGDTHYFTIETGTTLRNTETGTRRMLQAIEAHLLARSLGDGPTA